MWSGADGAGATMENSRKPGTELTAAARALFDSKAPKGRPVAVALSGGMDSVALLDALLPLSSQWPLVACHVNHGLSASANSWERFCGRLCRRCEVPLYIHRATPPPSPAEASEHWARQERMRAFAQLPPSVAAVVAAHHADDQAETILFRVLRGTGAHGMGAMRDCTPLPGEPRLTLLRPWLGIERRQIADYARRRRLTWVEDDDNRNIARRRNFIRRRLLPLARHYFPDSGRSLAAAAFRFRQAGGLLTELADEDEQRARIGGGEFMLSYFQTMDGDGGRRLQNWLHVFLLRRAARFSERGLAEAARQLMACGGGELSLRLDNLTLRTWRGRLHADLLPPPPSPESFNIALVAGRERHELPQLGGALILRPTVGGGLDGEKIRGGFVARLRRGGEQMPLPDGRARPVSDLLREADIAPWRRRRLPLLFVGEDLAAVPGVAVAAGFAAGRGQAGLDCQMEWPGGLMAAGRG